MPRAIWSGAISFGLVNVPVKLYSAVQRKTVRFHQLDADTGERIQQKRVRASDQSEVPYERIVKGYELSPDRYVIIKPEELEAVEPTRSRTIDIQEFVDQVEIDPIFYDHPYYLAPGTGAQKPYKLLLEAMRDSGKVAIARVVIRQKEHLVAIRPAGDVLAMETMIFADEIVDPGKLDELPEDDVVAGDRELKMAQQLIDSLAGPFEPEKYRDEYRDAVLEMIERKAAGEEITVQAEAPQPAEVPDLMAALEASLAQVGGKEMPWEGNGGEAATEPAPKKRAPAKKAAAKKPAAKKTAAKKPAAKK